MTSSKAPSVCGSRVDAPVGYQLLVVIRSRRRVRDDRRTFPVRAVQKTRPQPQRKNSSRSCNTPGGTRSDTGRAARQRAPRCTPWNAPVAGIARSGPPPDAVAPRAGGKEPSEPQLPSRTGLRSRKPPSLVRSTRPSSSAFCVRERSGRPPRWRSRCRSLRRVATREAAEHRVAEEPHARTPKNQPPLPCRPSQPRASRPRRSDFLRPHQDELGYPHASLHTEGRSGSWFIRGTMTSPR